MDRRKENDQYHSELLVRTNAQELRRRRKRTREHWVVVGEKVEGLRGQLERRTDLLNIERKEEEEGSTEVRTAGDRIEKPKVGVALTLPDVGKCGSAAPNFCITTSISMNVSKK